MIDQRRLYFGLITAAVGWQILARLTATQPRAAGVVLVLAGLCGVARPDSTGEDENKREDSELGFFRPILSVTGGSPVLRDDEGRAIYSESRFGRGRVGVLVDSFTLSKSALGSRFTDNPSPLQRRNLQTVYLVLKRMLEGPGGSRPPAGMIDDDPDPSASKPASPQPNPGGGVG